MKKIFDEVSLKCSEITTKHYSTSFSLGIKLLDKKIHNPIYDSKSKYSHLSNKRGGGAKNGKSLNVEGVININF